MACAIWLNLRRRWALSPMRRDCAFYTEAALRLQMREIENSQCERKADQSLIIGEEGR
jgi:hypothetical protein